jgi:hypothetical protein
MVESLVPGLDTSKIQVSEPFAVSKEANTVVRINGLFKTGTYGSFPFFYNRYDLAAIAKRTIVLEDETTVAEILAKINVTPLFTYTLGSTNPETRQCLLTEADIVNETLSVPPGTTLEYGLKAAATSYLFRGVLKLSIVNN